MSECENCKGYEDEIVDLKDEIRSLERKVDELNDGISEMRRDIEKCVIDLDLHEVIWALEQI